VKPLDRIALKNIQLRILDIFHAECKRHDISFFLYYGSLIGAIRHKGMIPWDDDIDIAIPRDAYEKLDRVEWDKHGLQLLDPIRSSNSIYSFKKLTDLTTLLIEDVDGSPTDMGVSIDLFPVDELNTNDIITNLTLLIIFFSKYVQTVKTVKLSSSRPPFRNFALAVGKYLAYPLQLNKIVRLAAQLTRTLKPGDVKGSILGPYGSRELMTIDWFKTTLITEFEGRHIPIPCGYHNILNQLYGNYMEMPPVHKQKSHHSFRAYQRHG
jgi:phosphorylcholine metabolism protein LicD